MPQNNTLPEAFLDEADSLLSANQENLQVLLEQVGQHLKTPATYRENRHTQTGVNFQHLQEQLHQLLKQTQFVQAALEKNFEGASPNSYPLSRAQLFQRQEEEKARTAKDLEDTIAQPIANAIFELAAVRSLISAESNLGLVTEGVNALQEELEQSLTDLRLLIADLEPNTILGNFGLVAGLRRYLEKFKEQTGLETALQVKTLIEPLPNIIEIAIFRVIQEALQNIRQHANASTVEVVILEENENLQFSVFDNGAGLRPNLSAHNQRQLGFVSMKGIADLLEGALELKTEAGKGTQVILTIPYPKL
ncbi:MAG TPA: hypothetical protein G4N96_00240 [Chloroflexi bacterium]|nr:MAG: hypothetical protein B6243_10090 [Anaerolineaceae bacterium 4572_5.2]HEY83529.1 hypothetical protein [Chloroflexota bacterium]